MLKNLKNKVEYCLEHYPETRNSDIALTIKIWQVYYGVGDTIAVEQLYNLSREDNVKRIRAHFQNDKGRFVPTVWAVAKQRNFKEEEWRRLLGYNPELKTPEPQQNYRGINFLYKK
jgi:hypothetical protein